LAQDKNQWWVLANTVINLLVPQKVRNFLTSWEALLIEESQGFRQLLEAKCFIIKSQTTSNRPRWWKLEI
jgi:hypothetical protein